MKEGRREEEERRKGARPCLEMESLTGILMRLNLCISSVCSPERGGGGRPKEREREREREGRSEGGSREKGVRVEVKEGGYIEAEKSKTMAD